MAYDGINSCSTHLENKIREWLDWDKNGTTRGVIEKLSVEKNYERLEELLLSRLNFGTAGLRGVMEAGYSRMNDLVIIQTSQGLAKYLLEVNPNVKNEGVVIGYDGRHNSSRFAKLTAAAFMACQIPTYLYSKMVPTPFVPFGVNYFKAAAGIMVTASHNPKDDNGFKVYWTNGAQIITPHDKGIQGSILQNLTPWSTAWDEKSVESNPLCKDPLPDVMTAYYQTMDKTMLDKNRNKQCRTIFTFTPMHGVGYVYMLKAFDTCQFPPFVPVKEQILPDPEFPTVKFPNPEEGKSALDLAMKTADENNSTIILANDPDADRLAVAEKQIGNGQWKIFTGNEIGALLGWWLWHCWQERNNNATGKNVYMISSTVSSKILRAIGNKEGFNFIETLTGFKWMGNKSHELINAGKTVLFAFEEAIGFMCGSSVLDKDGVSAAVKVAEMKCFLDSQDLTLCQQLFKLYQNYGYHVSKNSYYLCYDQLTIEKLFSRLRNYNGQKTYPKNCGEWSIDNVRDLTVGYDNSCPDSKATLPTSKSCQMITFTFGNGCVATLRTSGTEPKIKYYTELCAAPTQTDWSALEVELSRMVNCIVEEFLQPTQNKLIPRTD